MIVRGASNIELKEVAKAEGMMTLRDSGIEKIKEGVTTLEECVRVTFGD